MTVADLRFVACIIEKAATTQIPQNDSGRVACSGFPTRSNGPFPVLPEEHGVDQFDDLEARHQVLPVPPTAIPARPQPPTHGDLYPFLRAGRAADRAPTGEILRIYLEGRLRAPERREPPALGADP